MILLWRFANYQDKVHDARGLPVPTTSPKVLQIFKSSSAVPSGCTISHLNFKISRRRRQAYPFFLYLLLDVPQFTLTFGGPVKCEIGLSAYSQKYYNIITEKPVSCRESCSVALAGCTCNQKCFQRFSSQLCN